MIITIDGSAASGKSVIGTQLAHNLQGTFIDSGIMYRAATVVTKNYIKNIPSHKKTLFESLTREKLDEIIYLFLSEILIEIDSMELQFSQNLFETKVFLNHALLEDITAKLHEKTVSFIVPSLAKIPEIRIILNARLQEICKKNTQLIIIAGRDMWEVFASQAAKSFYITAPLHIRGARRAGIGATEEGIRTSIKQIKERDRLDMTREHGKLLTDQEFKKRGISKILNTGKIEYAVEEIMIQLHKNHLLE